MKKLGESPAASPGTKAQNLTCAVCQEIYTAPKILPCFHTFCQRCLEDVRGSGTAGASRSSFPCPTCGEDALLPAGGVAAFRSNPYLKAADLEKARCGVQCLTHPDREAEMFCRTCERCICLVCKVNVHLTHETEEVRAMLVKIRRQLSDNRSRLILAVEDSEILIKQVDDDKEAMKEKTERLKAEVQERHASIVAAAESIRDEELAALDAAASELESASTARRTEMVQQLQKLQEIYETAEGSQAVTRFNEVLNFAKKVNDACGQEAALRKLIPQPLQAIIRPVLLRSNSLENIADDVRSYIGKVSKSSVPAAAPMVKIEERLGSGSYRLPRPVTALYPQNDDSVWICYEPGNLSSQRILPHKFDKSGRLLRTCDVAVSKMSWKQQDGLFISSDDIASAKSRRPFLLNAMSQGKVALIRMGAPNPGAKPSSLEDELVCMVLCQKHRAFDVDASLQWLAIVEESTTPKTGHKVKLFQVQNAVFVDSYSPPNPAGSFQPLDVCFWRPPGQDVLLIADARDAVHVVSYLGGRLAFLRYLNPACPLIVQPTALNVDYQGRLWLACGSGNVLVCSPVAEALAKK